MDWPRSPNSYLFTQWFLEEFSGSLSWEKQNMERVFKGSHWMAETLRESGGDLQSFRFSAAPSDEATAGQQREPKF